MTLCPEPLVQIQNNLTEMFLMMPSTKIIQNLAQLKNMATKAKKNLMPFDLVIVV